MSHLFVNVFEFGGVDYIAEAEVRGGEEKIGLVIEPPVHPDLEEAVKDHLMDWLGEVVICQRELRRGKVL